MKTLHRSIAKSFFVAMLLLSTSALQAQSVDLSLTKIVSNQTPNELEPTSYTLLVKNVGTSPATGVKLSNVLSPQLKYVDHTVSQGAYNIASGLWTLGDLGIGEERELIITISPKSGTANNTIHNIAYVSRVNQIDSNLSNNNTTISLMVNTSNMSVQNIASPVEHLEDALWSGIQ